MNNQNYFTDDDLIYNPSSRIPVCICIDTSGSMKWYDDTDSSRIDRVREGIKKLFDEILKDETASISAEVCIVGFNAEPYIIRHFSLINDVNEKLEIYSSGKGDIGVGVLEGLKLLEERKNTYKKNGIDYYQPWLIIMTDGHSTGDQNVKVTLKDAHKKSIELERNKKLTIVPVYIGEDLSNDKKAFEDLSGFSNINSPISIAATKFNEFFVWLGKSVSAASVQENVELEFVDLTDWDEI